MIILDDIGEDYFLKVRGVKVLLIEDIGGQGRGHGKQINISET